MIQEHDPLHEPIHIVAKALCRFPDGAKRRLYATQLSLASATILSVEPPPLGELVEIVLFPLGMPALPPIWARVIRAQADVAIAGRNHFDVSFQELDGAFLDKLASALIGMDELRMGVGAFAERRGALRVKVDQRVRVEAASGCHAGILANVSMSGALLCLASDTPPSAVARGARLGLVLAAQDPSETVTLDAEVVWAVLAPGRHLAGVRFAGLDAWQRVALHDLILLGLTRRACTERPGQRHERNER